MTYFVKSPKGARRTFSILERSQGKSKAIPSKELDAINKRYAAGEAYDICRQAVVALKDHYRDKAKQEPINTNARVVAQYFANRSTHHLVDPNAAKRELIRAAEACGEHKLDLVDKAVLQRHIDRTCRGNKHRRIVAGVNRLLRSLGKPWRLQKVRLKHKEPVHLGMAAFIEILPTIEPIEHRYLLGALFATGARVSEAFAMTLRGTDCVWIAQQLKYDLETYQGTKTGPARNAVVVPELMDYAKLWVSLPDAIKRSLRQIKWSTVAKVWLGITARDLRHCYAKRLAEKGATLKEIADNLGNSEGVAKSHYEGWVQSDSRVSVVAAKLRGG